MPKARNPLRDEAFKLWARSKRTIKLKDLAAQLGVADSQVRKWKTLDKWEEQWERIIGSAPKKGAKVPNAPKEKKKRGAPKGNKYAIGNHGGAPLGSQNALKHGGYSAIYWDQLSDEERDLIDTMPVDEETMLLDQIKLYIVRERRLLQAMEKVRKATSIDKDGKTVTTDLVTNGKTYTTTETYGESPIKSTTKTSTAEHKDNRILRMQQELTRIQRAKTDALNSLSRMHIENKKLSLFFNDDEEIEDTSETDDVIYGEKA